MQVPCYGAVIRPAHEKSDTVWVIIAVGARVDKQVASKRLVGWLRFVSALQGRLRLHQKSWCPAISLRPASPGVDAPLSIIGRLPTRTARC
jgi:hypothetical protein